MNLPVNRVAERVVKAGKDPGMRLPHNAYQNENHYITFHKPTKITLLDKIDLSHKAAKKQRVK